MGPKLFAEMDEELQLSFETHLLLRDDIKYRIVY